MKITFIAHSGFLIELESCYLIFDYYKGKLPELNPKKPVYIFASHAHRDHFVFDIFKWNLPNKVKFILSRDIHLSDKYLIRKGVNPSVKKSITFVSKDKEYRIDHLKITTLTSTDVGVAFVVRTDEKLIYHAGDLNVWNFVEEMTRKEQAEMLLCYEREMKKLKDLHFDAAFIPADPRLKENMSLGIDYFLKYTDADVIYPMHMWNSKKAASKFLSQHKKYIGKVENVSIRGQVFIQE